MAVPAAEVGGGAGQVCLTWLALGLRWGLRNSPIRKCVRTAVHRSGAGLLSVLESAVRRAVGRGASVSTPNWKV